jgi:transposase
VIGCAQDKQGGQHLRLVAVTDADRRALDAALRTSRRVRAWRRRHAVRLLADGREAPEGAPVLGGSASRVYDWAKDWRAARVAGWADGRPAGRPRRLEGDPAATLEHRLADAPPAHGSAAPAGPVALLRTALARAGSALRARPLRRTVHRRGVRWQRPN